MDEIKTERVLGLKISLFTITSIKNAIINFIRSKEQKVFFGYSLVLLPRFRSCPEIFTYSDTFDLFVADGKGMYWIFKIAGVKLQNDISLPDLAEMVLELANENKFSVMLLGAEEEVNRTATEKIRLRFPNAIIFDGINGYFKKEDEEEVVKKINDVRPDILLIGISSPKKEKFVFDWRSKLETSLLIPCGGVIDVLAEKTSREPLIIKKTGLTWIYRFIQEPVRLFRPVLLNGLSVIFFLIPVILLNVLIRKNKTFSIPGFYGIKTN
ncbi:MAG: WecB/TagA/CpsF family glycosyltransferase [Ignavibacteria bacterium]